MGGSPSTPAAPPAPDPLKAAEANNLFYRSSLETYLQTQPQVADLENKIREKYGPRQRALDREMAALDLQKTALAQLQVERELGPQRSIEAMKRQYELSPNAFAVQQGLGKQAALQFQRLYGSSPMEAIPASVQTQRGIPEIDYLSGIPRTGVI
jgi:hypothetical protein